MTTELVLLGTAGAPMPVVGRGGISSALIVDERVFVIDCGRGSPSAFVEAGLDFTRLEAVLLTHLHVDHTGDLVGMLLYPWGVRTGDNGPLPPIRVYGPSRPDMVPAGDAVFEDDVVRVTTVAVTHGRALPALAYRFDTADGSVVFSGDTTVNDDLIAFAQGADILVHSVADLHYLEQHGFTGAALERMAALHTDVTEVGGVAERARVHETHPHPLPSGGTERDRGRGMGTPRWTRLQRSS
jgi:ribonuclease BN (tRNA processing enzyme)